MIRREAMSKLTSDTMKGIDMITIDEMTANILAAWDALTADDIAKGRAWYPVANDLARMLGNGDVRKGAGVIAAMSPLKSWKENVRLATDAVNGNVHGTFGDAIRKVERILDGADPCDVLPMDAKTGNFYANILDPSDPAPVTIDRHAYRVATGEKMPSGIKGKRYAEVAQAYRNAAAARGVNGATMQAGVWGPMAQGGYGI